MTFTGKELDEETGLQYFGARYYDGFIGRWISRDKLTGQLNYAQSLNRYLYVENNPLVNVDPDGNALETAWDVFNVVQGTASFVKNVKQGNFGAATIDAVGVVLDSAAVAVPGFPAGAGTIIKVARGTDKVIDGVKSLDKAADAKKAVHGNSKASKKPQHLYEIYDKDTGNVLKTGISGQTLKKSGRSKRADTQVRKLNKKGQNVDAEVVDKNIPGRTEALKREQANVNKLTKKGNNLREQKRPKPNEN